jgi:hypothetical protein
MSGLNHRFRVVAAAVRLVLADQSEGGITQSIQLPTQSIVFKFLDGGLVGAGLIAVIDVPGRTEVHAGMAADAEVVFPDAPASEEFASRTFELWAGRRIGTASIVAVLQDTGARHDKS